MLPTQPEEGSSSPLEAQLQAIEGALDSQLGVKVGADLVNNIRVLRGLAAMNKFHLESFLSHAGIISLRDEEYRRLQIKISELLLENEEAARQQGIDFG